MNTDKQNNQTDTATNEHSLNPIITVADLTRIANNNDLSLVGLRIIETMIRWSAMKLNEYIVALEKAKSSK